MSEVIWKARKDVFSLHSPVIQSFSSQRPVPWFLFGTLIVEPGDQSAMSSKSTSREHKWSFKRTFNIKEIQAYFGSIWTLWTVPFYNKFCFFQFWTSFDHLWKLKKVLKFKENYYSSCFTKSTFDVFVWESRTGFEEKFREGSALLVWW